jgi:putative endonuclease
LSYLRRKSFDLVCRNWHCGRGEIDLIMIDRSGAEEVVVFVEVKSRTGVGYLFDNITEEKSRQLRHLASCFMRRRFGRRRWPAYRIDLVGVELNRDQTPRRIEHIRAGA